MSIILYASSHCQHCNNLVSLIQQRGVQNIKIVDIHRNGAPQGVTSVPSMTDHNGTLYVGKACFDIVASIGTQQHQQHQQQDEIASYDLNASYGGFSYIENNFADTLCGGFSEIEELHETNDQPGNNIIDDLVAKRNAEIPQPIQRM